MKTMKNCKLNIEKLKVENEMKEKEIERKKAQLIILRQKKHRLEAEKKGVLAYQEFLERVREQFSDEYNEVRDIRDRHTTLKGSNEELSAKLAAMNNELEAKKKEFSDMQSDLGTKVTTLSTTIKEKSDELDMVE